MSSKDKNYLFTFTCITENEGDWLNSNKKYACSISTLISYRYPHFIGSSWT